METKLQLSIHKAGGISTHSHACWAKGVRSRIPVYANGDAWSNVSYVHYGEQVGSRTSIRKYGRILSLVSLRETNDTRDDDALIINGHVAIIQTYESIGKISFFDRVRQAITIDVKVAAFPFTYLKLTGDIKIVPFQDIEGPFNLIPDFASDTGDRFFVIPYL